MRGVQVSKIILFDGDCSFCNQSVQFILKRDPEKVFQFASLQSELGQCLLKQHNIPSTMDSLVYVEGARCFVKSTAALRICRHLRHVWKVFVVFLVIPSQLRDVVYDVVAKNRYRLKCTATCSLPQKEDLNRFLS